MTRLIRYPLILALCLACTAAFSQTAVITGPSTGAAGYPVRFGTTGSQGSKFEWSVVPVGAAPSLSPDRDGRELVFANPHNGPYVLILVVDRGLPSQSDTTHTLTLIDGVPGPAPPGPPLPPPVDLSEYVKRLTDDVEAKGREFSGVSDIFFDLARRIRTGEFRSSSAAILGETSDVGATSDALFGKAGVARANWKAWYGALRTYLLNDMVLIEPKQWSDAFEVIGEAVKR